MNGRDGTPGRGRLWPPIVAVACLVTTAVGAIWGCSEGSAATPPAAPGAVGPVPCSDVDAGGYSICPCDISPTFSSIYTKVLATDSCGSDRTGSNCHWPGQFSVSTTINLPFVDDAGLDPLVIYHELILPDGGGVPAQTPVVDAVPPILRVAPGDPDASLIYHKLLFDGGDVPSKELYGPPMPYPGGEMVCPTVVNAVEQWIQEGAPYN